MADTHKPLSYVNEKNQYSSFLILKERVLYFTIFLLFLLCVFLTSLLIENNTDILVDTEIDRSENELITVAKKFVSCLYGVDASTIREDQLCAIRFMLSDDDIKNRRNYLKVTNLINMSEEKGVKSFFLWSRSKVNVSDNEDDSFDISLQVPYSIVGISEQLIDIIVTVKPVDYSVKFHGAGVLRWRDIALSPFSEDAINE